MTDEKQYKALSKNDSNSLKKVEIRQLATINIPTLLVLKHK